MTSLGSDNDLASAYLAAAPDAIIVVDGDGNMVLVNDQAEALFGYDRSELLGRCVDMLIPENLKPAHEAHRLRYASEARTRPMGDPGSRLQGCSKDGTLVPIDVALSPLKDANGHGAIAVVRDLRPRLAAEAAHEIVRRTLDAVDDAVFMFDPVTLQYTYVNEGAQSQVGYDRYVLIGGKTPMDIAPQFSEQDIRQLVSGLLDGSESSVALTTTHQHQDGHTVPVDILIHYPFISETAPRMLVAVVRDVTERQAAEDRRQTNEAAFRSAFDEAPVAMVITKNDEVGEGQIVRANAAFHKLLGIDEETLEGTDLSAYAADADNRDAASHLPGAVERLYRRQDGSTVWGAVHVSELHSTANETQHLSHIVDVNRRVEAERQRDRREHLLASLADVRRATMMEAPIDDVLSNLLTATCELLTADHGFIAVRSIDGALTYRAMASSITHDQSGLQVPDYPLIQQVLNDGKARAVTALSESSDLLHDAVKESYEFGPGFVAPLIASGSLEGVFVAARPMGGEPFTADEIAIGASLASEVAVTMDLARARSDRRRIFLVEDRERIARDLHDVVIQRLLAAGMGLQASLESPSRLTARAASTVDELDATIDVIRETIFHLKQPDLSLEGEIRRVIERYRTVGRNDVTYSITGDVEALPDAVGGNLIPTITELLSNVERHAEASAAVVSLAVTDELTLTVTDDGTGIDKKRPLGFGIRNITNRAEYLGGSVSIEAGPAGIGTKVTWSAPLKRIED